MKLSIVILVLAAGVVTLWTTLLMPAAYWLGAVAEGYRRIALRWPMRKIGDDVFNVITQWPAIRATGTRNCRRLNNAE